MQNFIGSIWKQNCGDDLRVINESEKKYYYKCQFQKYPCEVLAFKSNIIKGKVNNPQIEIEEFVGKLYPQNGDILKVLKKTDKYINSAVLFECEFQKYPCIIYETKNHIKRGQINNPQIEQVEFVDKIWPQNCGDSLKIIEKTDKKSGINKGNYLWKCEFIKYPYVCYHTKNHIKEGCVDNLALPWRNKNSLIKYIKNNFKEKPTLQELAGSLNISISHICNILVDNSLQEYINYYQNYQENNLKIFIDNFDKSEQNYYIQDNNKYYEIDIFCKDKNIGFEYNGNYWHSELFKQQNYHQEKSLVAKKQGIQLIHIFEYEWQDLIKRPILESLIKSKFGLFEKKIFARKCKIREIPVNIYQDFCNENHLQGSAGAKVKLGLFYQDELVQIMSFSLPRFTNDFDWEIIRECSKLNYCIIGGKEKLWKYFVKKYNPKNCISYCDFSKFIGNSYLKLGFEKERLNKPGFIWWDEKTKQVFQRSPWKHKEMKEKYIKIYDCGQLVFTWNKE